MKFYSEQQVKLALKEMLEWHEFDVTPSMDSLNDDFWHWLARTEEMKEVQGSVNIEPGTVI